MIKIACVGDVMPAGVHHGKKDNYIKSDVLEFLKSFDIRVATLECAIGDKPSFDPEKMVRKQDIVYAPTSDLYRVKEMGIDVVSLANNHAFDLGEEGLINTCKQLDKLGIKYCGAGLNSEEASRPAVVTFAGVSIAFLAFCDWRMDTVGYVPFATENKAGMNEMREKNIKESIEKNKSQYDHLFIFLHWGVEYSYFPTPSMKTLADKILNWGADGIIGGHTHRIQPLISSHNKFIYFSLGNFFFPNRYINKPRPTYYPSEGEDLSNCPYSYGWPYVSHPLLMKWRETENIGMIGCIEINDNVVCASYRLTKLCDNIIEGRIRKPFLFKISQLMVGLPFYLFSYFLFRAIRSIYFRSKKMSRLIFRKELEQEIIYRNHEC